MNNHVLEVKNLTKKFGKFIAVDNISFSMADGEILGLLGPNGAGKTTTIQMLLGILVPTAGKIEYFGKNLFSHKEEILEKVNFSSTYTNLPWLMTVRENLTFVSYLYEIKNRRQRLEKIVSLFRLAELLNKKISELSSGQNTRVNLAKAFINFPKILLLDEPTASLDPETAKYMREFLLKERNEFGVSIVFTSHNMAEVEEVCDRVIFINSGKIVADDTPDNLAKSIEICHVNLVLIQGIEKAKKYFEAKDILYRVEGRSIICDIKEKNISSFLNDLNEENINYSEISIEKPTLEDYFLEAAKKKV